MPGQLGVGEGDPPQRARRGCRFCSIEHSASSRGEHRREGARPGRAPPRRTRTTSAAASPSAGRGARPRACSSARCSSWRLSRSARTTLTISTAAASWSRRSVIAARAVGRRARPLGVEEVLDLPHQLGPQALVHGALRSGPRCVECSRFRAAPPLGAGAPSTAATARRRRSSQGPATSATRAPRPASAARKRSKSSSRRSGCSRWCPSGDPVHVDVVQQVEVAEAPRGRLLDPAPGSPRSSAGCRPSC